MKTRLRCAWVTLIVLVSLLGGCFSSGSSPSASKDITSFKFVSLGVSATIAGTAINVRVPNGTVVTGLVATFTTTGVSVKVGSTEQASGATSNDFSSVVAYTVTAADGSTKSYSVFVYGPLDARRYLSANSIPASDLVVAAGEMTLKSGAGLSNVFPEGGPIVFLNGAAPVNMTYGTVYYAEGSGTATIKTYALEDSHHYTFTNDSQVGTGTVYQVDWTLIHVGQVVLTSGTITVPGHGLHTGDSVYLAASPGNASLQSGAYLVAPTPTADTLTLTGAAITPGDSFNYLAKIGDNGGTAF
jgi:hypothetical protein